MTPNPIALCLYTSTKGHFGRSNIYQKTINNLLTQLPAEHWSEMHASLKIDSSSEDNEHDMASWLHDRGFQVWFSRADWKHGDDSHQIGFLNDQIKVLQRVQSPYVLLLEDDWVTQSYVKELPYWLSLATHLLRDYPNLMQVRIPRFSNERTRIEGLQAKHGLDGRTQDGPNSHDEWFLSTDWSNNPHVARTRDVRAALTLTMLTNLPKHSEHGVGQAMKMLAWQGSLPFAVFNPTMVRCGHLGTLLGEEDDLSKELVSI